MASRSVSPLTPIGGYLLAGMLAVGLGFVASTGNLAAVLVVAGLLGGVILISNPTLILWSVLVGGLVVSGLAMLYAPQLQLVRWGVALASLLLIAMAALEQLSPGHQQQQRSLDPIGVKLLALAMVVLLSAVINGQGVTQIIVGLKSYFQVLGLFFALLLLPWPRAVIEAMPKAMLYLGFLQLPFVLHQFVFLVPLRSGYGDGVVPYDVIAGTFGATTFGGGNNAVLAAFLLMIVAVLLALWNNRAISLSRLCLLGVPLVAPVFVTVSKVSVLYLLLIVLVIFRNEIARRPGRALLSGGLIAVVLSGLMVAYTAFYAEKSETASDLIAGTINQNFSEEQGHGGYYLNRWTAITFWFEEHHLTRPVPLLFGHGPRSSREGGTGLDAGATLASRRYPGMGIGLTGASALLWETGLVGALLVASLFATAYRKAGQLRTRFRSEPASEGLYSGLQAGIAILALSMFHKSFFVFDIAYQTLIMLLFGFLVWSERQADQARDI